MFNKEFISVLSQINGLTNSIVLKYPRTVAVTEAQDILIHLDVSKVDTTEFPEIGLNNSLNEFLSLFKLFGPDRNVSLDGSNIVISDGNITSSYITDNIQLLENYNKDATQFDRTEEIPSVAEFTLTTDDISKIKSASGVFKDLSEVIVTSKDSDVTISLGATNKFNAKSNTFSISKEASTSKDFSVKIDIKSFTMIPSSNYTVKVKYNSSRDAYRLLLVSESLEGFKLIMSVKI